MKKTIVILLSLCICLVLYACQLHDTHNKSTGDVECTSESNAPSIALDILQYPTENDEWKYDVYTNHVVLTEYKGFDVSVNIPETLEGLPVTELKASDISGENGCFSGNKTIQTVFLTESIKRIGGFEYSNIANIVFANDESIEFDSHTFQGCNNIQNVNEIISHMSGEDVFPGIFKDSNSTALNSLVIPNRFNSIDNFAFFGCSSLQYIDVGNVSKIGAHAFMGTSLEKITVHNKNCEIDLTFMGSYGEFGNLVIAAPAGSTAAQIASRFSLTFEVITE